MARQTDDRSQVLKPALELPLLVAAVIVHDEATNRVVLLQRSENAKFAQGLWDLRWVDASAIPEAFADTTASALHHYLNDGSEVSLDDWSAA